MHASFYTYIHPTYTHKHAGVSSHTHKHARTLILKNIHVYPYTSIQGGVLKISTSAIIYKKQPYQKIIKEKKSSRRCCCVCLYNTGLFLPFVRVTEPFVSGTRGTFRDRRVSQPRGGVVRHKAEGKWTENGREGRCRALSVAEERAIGNGERFRKLSRGFPHPF